VNKVTDIGIEDLGNKVVFVAVADLGDVSTLSTDVQVQDVGSGKGGISDSIQSGSSSTGNQVEDVGPILESSSVLGSVHSMTKGHGDISGQGVVSVSEGSNSVGVDGSGIIEGIIGFTDFTSSDVVAEADQAANTLNSSGSGEEGSVHGGNNPVIVGQSFSLGATSVGIVTTVINGGQAVIGL
jgi:hypothetical protein